MKTILLRLFPALLLLATLSPAPLEASVALSVKANFFPSPVGSSPVGGLIKGSDGNFYGTDSEGGADNLGSLFKITPSGAISAVTSFFLNSGNGGLVQDGAGNFYGTTSQDLTPGSKGKGTIFKVTPAGLLSTVATFSGANGAVPTGLIQGSDGNIYGIAQGGGQFGHGVFFRLTPDGVLTRLVSFGSSSTDADTPNPGLFQGKDGNFYGSSSYGGSTGEGTIFQITPKRVLTVLASFTDPKGGDPVNVIQVSDGNFYGTTRFGGTSGQGTVFKLTPSGSLTTLVSLGGTNGTEPSGLVQGSDGNLYGTTGAEGASDYGTVYKVTLAGILTNLVAFDRTTGEIPTTLVEGSSGNFYGTTETSDQSDGVVFKVTGTGTLTTWTLPTNTNGTHPVGLVQGSDGDFYGPAAAGGPSNDGAIFRMTRSGVLSTFAYFNGANGSAPCPKMVQAADHFYGTTSAGGAAGQGTIFELSFQGTLTTLVSFAGTNGATPLEGLILGSDNNFYGTTSAGGTSGDGTIFKMTPEGKLSTLVSFTTTTGSVHNGFLRSQDGTIYVNAGDSVFKLTRTGRLVLVASFPPTSTSSDNYDEDVHTQDDETYSPIGFVQAYDGSIDVIVSHAQEVTYTSILEENYLSAEVTLWGDIYEIAPLLGSSPVASVLVNHDRSNFIGGYDPALVLNLVQSPDGTFYGTASDYFGKVYDEGYQAGNGFAFSIDPAGSVKQLAEFDGTNGANPDAFILGQDGSFYGTASDGGLSSAGTVFRLAFTPEAQTLTFPAVGTAQVGQTLTLAATSTSGLPITYRVLSAPGYTGSATVSGNSLTFTGAGEVKIAADQPGNIEFEAAREVRQNVSVSKVSQIIAFPDLGGATVGQTVALQASSTSGLPITYSILPGTDYTGTAMILGDQITFTGTGHLKLAADQGGNATTSAAAQVRQNVIIKAAP